MGEVDPVRLLELSDRFGLERLKSLCELRITKLVNEAITESIAKSDIDLVSLLNYASAYNAPQLESWCLFFLASNYLALERSESASVWLENMSSEHREYVVQHRWPPVSYLEAVEAHAEIHAEWKENCERIKKMNNSNCRVRKSNGTQRCYIM